MSYDDLSGPLANLSEYLEFNRRINKQQGMRWANTNTSQIHVEPIKSAASFDPNIHQKPEDGPMLEEGALVIEQRLGRRLHCDSCQHDWTYFQKDNSKPEKYKFYVSCPRCRYNVKIKYTTNRNLSEAQRKKRIDNWKKEEGNAG